MTSYRTKHEPQPRPRSNTGCVGCYPSVQLAGHLSELMGQLIDPKRDMKKHTKLLMYVRRREVKRDAFEIREVLGRGNFGTVYKGILKGLIGPNSRTEVAIKTTLENEGEPEYDDFIKEIKIMGHVDPHLNLVSMIGACADEDEEAKLWLLIEYCHFGDLKDYLVNNKKDILRGSADNPINARSLIRWTYDIAQGMEYLMQKKIMHGDLAARNVMLCKNPLHNGYMVAMVADFGLSKNFYTELKYNKSVRLMVPWRWMAIEYLTNGYFTLNSDVWSFAVLFWEILSFGKVIYSRIFLLT